VARRAAPAVPEGQEDQLGALGLPAKRGRITAKGGITRWIHWPSGTARLLPRLTAGRTSGPVFPGQRRPAPARTAAAADACE
jgi:hypothetical protein